MQRGTWFSWFCLLGVMAVLLCCKAPNDDKRAASRSNADNPQAGRVREDTNRITLAKYESLSTGMSYDRVASALGSPGVEQSRSQVAGTTTVMYTWSNGDGSNMNAMFQNDRMVSKAQFGLR